MQRRANLELTKLQRLACLCITSAMKSTPTAAMETILNLPPLDIYINAEARMGAHRLKCNGNWQDVTFGHASITNTITDKLFTMTSDEMISKINYSKPFNIQLNWEGKVETKSQDGTLVWYTDGSKTDSGTGAGIYGERPRCRKYIQFSSQ